MKDAEDQRREDAARYKRIKDENDISDPENQKRFIEQATLRADRPVNSEAVDVLYALEEWIETNQSDWRLGFEVSMGAFIKTPFFDEQQQKRETELHKKAFSSYNSKRVDFLLIDRFGMPMLAVEYHGTGHYQSEDADDRMDVKRLALTRAGIPCVEIPEKTSSEDIKRMVTDVLRAPQNTRETQELPAQSSSEQTSKSSRFPISFARFISKNS
ncbi:MAG: DUF2726 domain-containing protein [Rhodospirillales bacterium]|nr:DUF2726 domain-containing protein [Rhodospirillales bacterium]